MYGLLIKRAKLSLSFLIFGGALFVYASLQVDSGSDKALYTLLVSLFTVFLGLAGSLLLQMANERSMVEQKIDLLHRIVSDGDLLEFDKAGQFEKLLEYDYLLDVKKKQFLNFIFRARKGHELIRATELGLALDPLSLACQIGEDLLRDDFGYNNLRVLFESCAENYSACKLYMENDTTQSSYMKSDIAFSIGQEFHERLNNIEFNSLSVIDAYIRIFKQIKDSPGDNISRSETLELVLLKIMAVGALGSMALIEEQFPWHDKNHKLDVEKLLRKYDFNIKLGEEVGLKRVLEWVFLETIGHRDVNRAIDDLEYSLSDVVHENSVFKGMYGVNKSLYLNASTGSYLSYIDKIDKFGNSFTDVKQISALNALSSFIQSGVPYTEESRIEKIEEILKSIEADAFYYEGYLLNLAILKITQGAYEEKRVLEELAKTANNFMAKATAARNLMTIYARSGSTTRFGKARDLYVDVCSAKDVDPLFIKMDDAKNYPLGGGVWYFTFLPTQKMYHTIRPNPWGVSSF